MPRIERFMPACGEAIMVCSPQIGWQLLHLHLPAFLRGINAVDVQPTIPIRTPAFENIFGHRIRRAPGDEDHAAVLRPVRQPSLGDEQLVGRVEKAHGEMLEHPRNRASKVAILLRKMSTELAQTKATSETRKRPCLAKLQAHLDGARWLLCFALCCFLCFTKPYGLMSP